MTATLEDIKTISINKWGSLNTVSSPNRLPEGQSPNNQNVWMDEKPGSVVTANAYLKLGELPSGNPPTFLLDYFKTSEGSQTVICSDGETVWKTTNYVDYTVIKAGLSSFFQLRGAVIRGKLWLTNGSDAVMTYDGTTLNILDGSAGTPNVPLGKYIAYHDERVWIYGISGDPSSLRFSDLSDSSGTEITPDDVNAWPTDNEIQISEGDDDIGTGIFLYRGYLYVSKAFSVWRIVGYDEFTYTRVKTRSSTGTRFQESVQILDNLVQFIGVDGLYTFDGEESERVSDIIDPASSEPGVFAFRNLQQPLLNNNFWNVSQTADWATGTVPNVLDTANDQLTLIPTDDSQADFVSGTLSDTDASSNPGFLQLALVTSGGSTDNISQGKSASLAASNGIAQIGTATQITDGNTTSRVGFVNTSDNTIMVWQIDLGSTLPVGRAILKGFYGEAIASSVFSVAGSKIQYSSDNTNWSDAGTVTLQSSSTGARVFQSGSGTILVATDLTTDFSTISARYWRYLLQANKAYFTLTELQIFRAGYKSTGSFISASIDYGVAPASFGALAASIVANGEAYQFSTQSSADGSTWEAAVNVSNGSVIGSTLQRYLRWRVTLNSSVGLNTPVIDKVFVGGTYLSEIHDTGGNIFQWGAFQLAQNKLGQTINAYYRAASTSGAVSGQGWTAIVPGAVPATDIANSFIQMRLEFSTTDATFAPYVTSLTINWIVGTGAGINTLQNVASFVWLNRYWLSAATLGSESNDIVLVRGKATFGSPFHKKDFAILSFARFQDYFIAGSSTDGSIYRMEYGYSKNGAAMDSYFETADFSDEFSLLKKVSEIVVNLDRSGPYSLSLGYSTDGGITWTDKTIDLTRATSSTNLSFTKRLNVSFMQSKFRLRVRINAADQPFSVDSIDVFYRPTTWRGSLN